MQVSFYRITTGTLEQTLAKLLGKIHDLGKRAVVVVDTEERAESINSALWTLGHASFLPHGTERDGQSDRQPIFITTTLKNPNNASVLILTCGSFDRAHESQAGGSFERCLILFDAAHETQTAEARRAWAAYQAAGHPLVLWNQNKEGEWAEGRMA